MKKRLLVFILLFVISVSSFVIWKFTDPTTSKADTYYNSINCPTPAGGRNTLQLIPCTPSGVNQPTSFSPQGQTSNTAPTTAPTATSTNNGTESGDVCKPDSTIAPGDSCKCQSDLEPDADCTVATATLCTESGGYPATGFDFNTGTFVTASPGSNNTSSTQCLWLDSAPVPASANATNCSIECNSKPVLYFYSPKTMNIDVSLDIPGFVTASIPTYPANGWQNVIVHPQGTADGTLSYNNKTYNELYYEDETTKATPPTQGFVIKSADLTSELRTYTTKLGLNTNEQNEFLNYWVPRLTQLNAPYIFFTVFDQTQKEKVDHVIVSPAPQTTIAFLAYFKPLSKPINVAPLQFPSVPKRQGFTFVEWGGTIENN
jgi:hypothetical protein